MLKAAIVALTFVVPVAARSLHSDRRLTSVDFEGFSAGDVVNNLGGTVSVVAKRITKSGLVPGLAMIFDSSNPTGDDVDLGTPNELFGGPGIGIAGVQNKESLGNVLIISEDGNTSNPDDNAQGGALFFKFSAPTFVDSIGLLDTEEMSTVKVFTSDGGTLTIHDATGGDNSFIRFSIKLPAIIKIVVTLRGSGAVTDIQLLNTDPECIMVEDFNSFEAGVVLSDFPNAIPGVMLKARKRLRDGTLIPGQALIFNTAAPTGDDVDLGTPHQSFGGPGLGSAGMQGQLFENREAQGMVLIISENASTSEPDDNKFGGLMRFRFEVPTAVNSIGILDNEEGIIFHIYTSESLKRVIAVRTGGDNSYQDVHIAVSNVVMIVVDFKGSGALDNLNLAICEEEEY